jgi:beta-lactamase superfamily II metal-dependent hydrolase
MKSAPAFFRICVLGLAVGAAGVAAWSWLCRPSAATIWTMLNVTPADGQADCHVVVMPGNLAVLIDAGDAWDAEGEAVRQIKRLGIRRFELAVISHFHRDHYGRLLDILDSGIRIERVAVSLPDRQAADRERPWGCDYDHVLETLQSLEQRGVPWFVPKIGERLLETTDRHGHPVTLDAVCLYDGVNTPIGPTDVNDTSILLRLTHGKTRALFTGDLNRPLGEWLATSDFDLRADLLKVPHHGTEGLAPNSFFDRVAPKAALVPSPGFLWVSARSMRTRTYMIENNIPVHVSGLHGQVTVTMRHEDFRIENEYSR